jgi:hypothetical protein
LDLYVNLFQFQEMTSRLTGDYFCDGVAGGLLPGGGKEARSGGKGLRVTKGWVGAGGFGGWFNVLVDNLL